MDVGEVKKVGNLRAIGIYNDYSGVNLCRAGEHNGVRHPVPFLDSLTACNPVKRLSSCGKAHEDGEKPPARTTTV
jgi:hypothetical protein